MAGDLAVSDHRYVRELQYVRLPRPDRLYIPALLDGDVPYEFYKMVPEGVTLVLTTLAVKQLAEKDVARSVEMTLEAGPRNGDGQTSTSSCSEASR